MCTDNQGSCCGSGPCRCETRRLAMAAFRAQVDLWTALRALEAHFGYDIEHLDRVIDNMAVTLTDQDLDDLSPQTLEALLEAIRDSQDTLDDDEEDGP